MATTVAPSGLTMERDDGLTFVCSWKVGDDDYNRKQRFEYAIVTPTTKKDDIKWTSAWVTTKDTSRNLWLSTSNYYPYTDKIISKVSFRVCGAKADTYDENPSDKKSYDWTTSYWQYYGYENQYVRLVTWYKESSWSQKDFAIYTPNKPSVEAELDSTKKNVTKFTWSVDVETNDHHPFARTEWQSMLVKNSNVTDGSKLSWKKTSSNSWSSGTGSRNSSWTKTEDSYILPDASWTRWFRIRSLGPGGASDWSYAKHVYSRPKKPYINTDHTWYTNYAGAISSVETGVRLTWSVATSASSPLDYVEAQYLIDTPEAGLKCPDGGSWSTAVTIADTGGEDQVYFTIDDQVDLDQCVWVRVMAYYDGYSNASDPFLIRRGALTPPDSIENLVIDSSEQRAEMSVANQSNVPGTYIAIVFRKEGQNDIVCGVITDFTRSKIVYCDFTDSSKISFGAYAFQGTYKATKFRNGHSWAPTQYSISANLKSSTIWTGGEVPLPPSNVTARQTREGEVLVDWGWSWVQAMKAEVSWSKDEYAWNSIEGPTTHMVDNMDRSDIRIPNLETGVNWYFRVRLAKETNGNLVFGPYSDTKTVNLATIPLKPILALSQSVITRNGRVTASWTYECADGLRQGGAEVQRVNIDSGGNVTPIKVVARVNTAKSVQLPTPIQMGIAAISGTIYLRVRVSSVGAQTSEWSDPVALNIAAAPTCTLNTSTSLAKDTTNNIYAPIFHCYSEVDGSEISYTSSSSGRSFTILADGIMEFAELPRAYSLKFGTYPDLPVVPEVTYSTELEAQTFVSQLMSYIEENDSVTLSYVKNLVGDTPGRLDDRFGWNSIDDANIEITEDENENVLYSVSFPELEYLLDDNLSYLAEIEYKSDGTVIHTQSLNIPSVPINEYNSFCASYPELNKEWLDECDSIVVKAHLLANTGLFVYVSKTTVYGLEDMLYLKEMPLNLTVTGAGKGGITNVVIERAEAYRVDRPDESVFNGFEGETIFSYSQTGENAISITNDMLVGSLDDGAKYRIIATVQDGLGQVATASQEFTVWWTHQALMPVATASVDEDELVAFITPEIPTGVQPGDTVDIYRLTADIPELIIKDGEFGTKYVDPYPASGITGGHRVVYKTSNGDYITNNKHAWVDLSFDDHDYLELIETIIDFNGDRVRLMYNMDLDNSWKKDFSETKYLGGSVQGDWNPGVSRSGSVSGVVVTPTDNYTVGALRRLASYAGVCHVRTPEGSSFSANVEVQESRDLGQGMGLVNFTLNFSKVDPEAPDGMTYEEWIQGRGQ